MSDAESATQSVPVTSEEPKQNNEQVTTTENPAPEAANKKAAKKTTKKVAKKKAKTQKMDDAPTRLDIILNLLYRLREKHSGKVADLRFASKEADQLFSYIEKQKTYVWERIGDSSYYYKAMHKTGGPYVAYVVEHDPRLAWQRETRDYTIALANPRIRNKVKKPEKPASFKKQYQWSICGRRVIHEITGFSATLELAKQEVESRADQFLV